MKQYKKPSTSEFLHAVTFLYRDELDSTAMKASTK